MSRPNSDAISQLVSVAIATTDERVPPEAERTLAGEYDLQMLRSREELLQSLRLKPVKAILLDLETVGERSADGVEFLRELRSLAPDVVLVAMTRSNSRSIRLKALEATADEYFSAPVDFDELRVVLGRALEKRAAEIDYRVLRNRELPQQAFCELVGISEPMQRIYAAITRVADSNSTIMIRGESGTGKELAARAIVAMSPRAGKPFISINCAALPEHLMESELFGHEKGAFTDARVSRPGQIELADTGTLFLDEIATLSLALQSKLLRVLEDRVLQRIGSKTVKKIDFRLITATNQDLEEMMLTGRFREDLYYRINVIPILMPALRERTGDVPLLVDHFLRIHCTSNKIPMKRVDPEVMEILEEDAWPGNVRELQNLIQRLVIMVEGEVIKAHHLPQRILYDSATKQESLLIPSEGVSFDQEISRIERAYLVAALRRSSGSKAGAARLLKMDKQKIHYLCRKYGIGKE
jgi:DNA-binding NtrC family response regulator